MGRGKGETFPVPMQGHHNRIFEDEKQMDKWYSEN
jgi:hypothetical protein